MVNEASDEVCSGLPALKTGEKMPPAGAGEAIASVEITVVPVFMRSMSPVGGVIPRVELEVLEVGLVVWEGKE